MTELEAVFDVVGRTSRRAVFETGRALTSAVS
jgi:hypothetical protein